MPASTPSARPISHITCFTNSCSTNRAYSSGVSSRHTSGTIPPSSARTSNVCWSAGSKNAATALPSSFGDYRTRASYPRNSLRNAQTLSARSTPPAATNAPSPPVMVAKAPTGTSSRTGAVLMVVLPTTTPTNSHVQTSCSMVSTVPGEPSTSMAPTNTARSPSPPF